MSSATCSYRWPESRKQPGGAEKVFTNLPFPFVPGDTPQTERARFARHPTDTLITTPESLYLLLTSNVREMLRSVEAVIVRIANRKERNWDARWPTNWRS